MSSTPFHRLTLFSDPQVSSYDNFRFLIFSGQEDNIVVSPKGHPSVESQIS